MMDPPGERWDGSSSVILFLCRPRAPYFGPGSFRRAVPFWAIAFLKPRRLVPAWEVENLRSNQESPFAARRRGCGCFFGAPGRRNPCGGHSRHDLCVLFSPNRKEAPVPLRECPPPMMDRAAPLRSREARPTPDDSLQEIHAM